MTVSVSHRFLSFIVFIIFHLFESDDPLNRKIFNTETEPLQKLMARLGSLRKVQVAK